LKVFEGAVPTKPRTAQGKVKRSARLTVRVLNAIGGKAGTETLMDDLARRDQSDPMTASPPLRSSDFDVFPARELRKRRPDHDRAGRTVAVGYPLRDAAHHRGGRPTSQHLTAIICAFILAVLGFGLGGFSVHNATTNCVGNGSSSVAAK